MRIVMYFSLATLLFSVFMPVRAELIGNQSISITSLLTRTRDASKVELWPCDSVAEDKLSVYVDSPSKDKVEQGLDLLPGYQWITIKLADGTIYKVLGPDYEERKKWSSLADAADGEDRRRIRQFANKRFAEYRSALALSEEDLRSLEKEDPHLVYDLTTPFTRAGVELLGGLNDELINQVLSPEGLRVNFRELPADMQENLIDSLREVISKSAQKHAKQDGKNALSVKELEEIFVNTGALQFYGYDMNGISMHIRSNDPWFEGCQRYIMKPKYIGYSEARTSILRAKGVSWDDIADMSKSEYYLFELLSDVKSKEKEIRLAETPPRFGLKNAPDVKVDKLQPHGKCMDIIQSICKQKGYSFFAYKDVRGLEVTIADNTQLGYALDLAADSLGDYVWAYHEGQIIFAPRHFSYMLAENIPASTITKLRKIAAQTGGVFDLDGLAEVVSLLNWRQIEGLPLNVPDDLRNSSIILAKTRDAPIKLYASLSPSQRKKACAGGVSFTVLGSQQKDLFYEALGSFITSMDLLPEPASFSINDRGSSRGRYHLFTLTFSLVDGTTWSTDLQLPVANSNNAALTTSKPDDKPVPTQPQVLAVVQSLAEWNYTSRKIRDGEEPQAVLSLQEGDKQIRRPLKVGATLEGAKLIEIGAKSVTFSLEGAQITFPITQSIALAPFDPYTPSIYTSWMCVDDAWADILKKELRK